MARGAERLGYNLGMPLEDRSRIAEQLRDQARVCAAMASPLYAHLLDHAADDVLEGGATWEVLKGYLLSGRGGALALRLMAAVHRMVLTGRAPELARHYPSVGGEAAPNEAWPAFHEVLSAHAAEVAALVALPCQTNEVGRSAALVFGFLEVAALTGLPLRVLEVGASAGLNLRWDRFCYGGGGALWGDLQSPVDLRGLWDEAPRHLNAHAEVVERRGCDLTPIDPTTMEGRLALAAAVWADQTGRFTRLRGAVDLAAAVPATVDAASLETWLPDQLAALRPGVATVVYHSVVDEYLPDGIRRSFHSLLQEAGARATDAAPLAWLQLEPLTELRHHGVRLVTWPGGEDRLIATCGAHGTEVRRGSA